MEELKMKKCTLQTGLLFFIIIAPVIFSGCTHTSGVKSYIKAAAAAVNIEVSDSLPIGGWITPRYTSGADAPLRAQVIVISDGTNKVCLGSCDVTTLHRDLLDDIAREVETKYGIPFNNFMFGATHSHGSPVQTSWSDTTADQTFNLAIKKAVIEAIGLANEKLNNASLMDMYFALGNATIGQNSRLIMDDSSILWVPTIYKFGYNRPTGPYDPELPVLAFKDKNGEPEAIVFNHSTHNINKPNPVPSRSPSFYGTASQEIEKELGGTVVFLPGAEGSTHVFDDCPTSERVFRVEEGIKKAYSKVDKRDIDRLVSVKKEFEFTIRSFNEDQEQKAVSDYCNRWLKESIYWHAEPEPIIQAFKKGRENLAPLQGKTQKTWMQVILLGDIAFVGVPGELFAELGMEIKRRSPFRYTYVVGLTNDYIGYLPDDEAFNLGGYQTWATRSYAERGTGELIVNQAIEILDSLYTK
jgi:hypothetical protein